MGKFVKITLDPRLKAGITIICIYTNFTISHALGVENASEENKIPHNANTAFPLPQCIARSNASENNLTSNCVSGPISRDKLKALDGKLRTAILNPDILPERYLELWNSDVINQTISKYCSNEENPTCSDQLLAYKDYLERGFMVKNGSVDREFGLALEGGGSKAAAFGLGVLDGLSRGKDPLIDKLAAISSTSGGGYAAHFYFSRELDRINRNTDKRMDIWFSDCVPSIYSDKDQFSKTAFNSEFSCSETSKIGNSLEGWSQYSKKYPYSAHLRKYSDLMSGKGDTNSGSADIPASIGSTLWSATETAATLIPLFGRGLASFFTSPHHLAHSIFDLPTNFSPSRWHYRFGIDRQFGHSPESWNTAMSSEKHISQIYNERRESVTLRIL